MLIIISGCSGVGKGTVINELLKRNSNMAFLKTCTTRKKRLSEEGDESKSPYIFISRDEFDQKIKDDEFVEYEEIHKNFYGMLKQTLSGVGGDDKVYLKDFGVLGKINITRFLENKTKVISIFLTAPREVLVERLKNRGESDIDLRLSRMEFEMSYVSQYDHVINNIYLDKTVRKIETIIKRALRLESNNRKN